MDPARYQRIYDLFTRARAVREAVDRAAFLDAECAADEPMRQEILGLLAADALPVSLDALGNAPAPVGESADPVLPDRIGPYRILRRLGAGGMGVVYLARQQNPDRLVALKVLRPDAAEPSSSIARRFEQEPRLLGRLRHPGIAQVFEAGVAPTEHGPRPFFAMEYVAGPSLLRFVRRRHLTITRRLDLFTQICDAVEHAHRHGIVHRDLKPDNILIDDAEADDGPPGQGDSARARPKILDFGVARSDAPDLTSHTETGQLLGTVSHMSPEQVSGRHDHLDPRSDVYALGVLLYELLTGRPPYDLAHKPLPEAARIIREQEPSRLGSIDTALRGDLETIAAKALEKDPERRYPSAAALAADIRRFLADEPIVARPHSSFYQLCKFARRNRGLVGGVAAAFVALSLGLAIATWQAVRATREAAAARASDDFFHEMLLSSDQVGGIFTEGANDALPVNTTYPNVIETATARFGHRFADQPRLEASVLTALGRLHSGQCRFEQAGDELRRALSLRRDHVGPDEDPTIQAEALLAQVYWHTLRTREALALCQHVLDVTSRHRGPEHPATLTAAVRLAWSLCECGDTSASMSITDQVIDVSCRALGPDNQPLIDARIMKCFVLCNLGRNEEARQLAADAEAMSTRLLGTDSFSTFFARFALGWALTNNREFSAALPVLDTFVNDSTKWLPVDHFLVTHARTLKADALVRSGRAAEAEPLLADLDRYLTELRPVFFELEDSAILACLMHDLGRHTQAIDRLRRTTDAMRRHFDDPESIWILGVESSLARTLWQAGQYDEARAMQIRIVDLLERKQPAPPTEFLNTARALRAEMTTPPPR